MGVEERAAVGRDFVHSALSPVQPVAVSIGPPGGDQRREWLVGQRAQMLLGPGEDILSYGAEARQVANVQAAWHVPARGPAQLAAAYGAAKTKLFPHQRQVSRDFHRQ